MSCDISNIIVNEDDEDTENYLDHIDIKKNLLADLTRDQKIEQNYVDVYVRVRPLMKEELEKSENQGCLEVVDNTSILVHAPKESHTYRMSIANKVHQKFTFSRVFDQCTNQKEFFDSTMLRTVKQFIDGQNCLVFTYGVTNSGKTYTIQGEPRDAGILPRALDVIFNSVGCRRYQNMNIKPDMFSNVVRLTREQENQEYAVKEAIMKMTVGEVERESACMSRGVSTDSLESSNSCTGRGSSSDTIATIMSEDSLDKITNSNRSPTRTATDATPEDDISTVVANRKREEATIEVSSQGHVKFSIWISFAEIYQEQIYDLLTPPPKKKLSRRIQLQLREDRSGQPYVKGLNEINVTSADEAYKLLALGKRNLQFACTKLNQSSSRSHCIFTIKMVRVLDKDDPRVARVSMLSLCDLAGTERFQKTGNNGDRLREASVINNSLMTLSRCIEILRSNQTSRVPKIVPFRDSKLTRLFQSYFTGHGRASMIVNISPCASMFDETLNAIKYSAIAKQVIVIPPNVVVPALKAKLSCVQEEQKKHSSDAITNSMISNSRNTIGWVSPGTYGQLIDDGELSVSIALSSDVKVMESSSGAVGGAPGLSDRALLDRRSLAVVHEANDITNDTTLNSTYTDCETSVADDDDDEVDDDDDDAKEDLRRATSRWAAERAKLVKVIAELRELLLAQIKEKNVLEQNLRAEICEEFKQLFVKIEEDHREDKMRQEEIHEELVDRKVEILAEAMRKASKRQRLDQEEDNDEYVSCQLLHAEQVKVERMSREMDELKDKVKDLEAELAGRANEVSTAYKERESLAVQVSRAEFKLIDHLQTLSTLRDKCKEAEDKLDEANSRHEELVRVSESEAATLQAKVEELERDLLLEREEKKKETVRVGEQVTGISKDKSELEERVEELQKNTERERDARVEAVKQNEILEEKIKNLEAEVSKASKGQMEALKEKQVLEDQIKELKEDLDVVKKEQQDAVDEGQRMEKRIRELEEELQTESEKFKKVDVRINELQKEVNEKKVELCAKMKENEELDDRTRKELDEAKNRKCDKCVSYESEIDRKGNCDREKDQELNRLKGQLSTLTEQNKQLNKSHSESNHLVDSYKKEMEEIRKQLNEASNNKEKRIEKMEKEMNEYKQTLFSMHRLAQQLSSDTENKDDLPGELSVSEGLADVCKRLEVAVRASEESERETETLRVRLLEREKEVETLKESEKEAETLREREQEAEKLKVKLIEREQEVQTLKKSEKQADTLKAKLVEREQEAEKLRGELLEKEQEVQTLEESKQEAETMREREREKEADILRESEREAETLREKEQEGETLRETLLESEKRSESLQSLLDIREAVVLKLKDELSELNLKLSSTQQKLNESGATETKLSELTSQIETLHADLKSAASDREKLQLDRQAESDQSKSQLSQLKEELKKFAVKNEDLKKEMDTFTAVQQQENKKKLRETEQRVVSLQDESTQHKRDLTEARERERLLQEQLRKLSEELKKTSEQANANKSTTENTLSTDSVIIKCEPEIHLSPPPNNSRGSSSSTSVSRSAAGSRSVRQQNKNSHSVQVKSEVGEQQQQEAGSSPAAVREDVEGDERTGRERKSSSSRERRQTRSAANQKIANIRYIDDDEEAEEECDENEFESVYSKNVRKSTRKQTRNTASKLRLLKRVDNVEPCPMQQLEEDQPRTPQGVTRTGRSSRTRKTVVSAAAAAANDANSVENDNDVGGSIDEKTTVEKPKRKRKLHSNLLDLQPLADTPSSASGSLDYDVIPPSPHTIVSRSLRTRKH